jgi:hypothetical protein
MEMVAQRCSPRAIHNVLNMHGWVVATSFGLHHHGSLLGSLDACLHGHDLVGALPSIQCLFPWPSWRRDTSQTYL